MTLFALLTCADQSHVLLCVGLNNDIVYKGRDEHGNYILLAIVKKKRRYFSEQLVSARHLLLRQKKISATDQGLWPIVNVLIPS